MIEKVQAEPPHPDVGMVQGSRLHRANRHVFADSIATLLLRRRPSMHEVIGEFEIGS
jgi:hypothetical protein